LYSTKKLAGIIKDQVKYSLSEKNGIHTTFYIYGILEPLKDAIFYDYGLKPNYNEGEKPVKDMKTIDELALEAHFFAMDLDSVESLSKERRDVIYDFVQKVFNRYLSAASEDDKPRYAA
jgi:hypothetical protein